MNETNDSAAVNRHDMQEDACSIALGPMLVATAVFGVVAALAVLWSGGTVVAAFLAYMLGGCAGLCLVALSSAWRRPPD